MSHIEFAFKLTALILLGIGLIVSGFALRPKDFDFDIDNQKAHSKS